MEFAGVRTIDELGRIVIPKEARQALGWGEKTEIEIYTHKDAIALERKKQLKSKMQSRICSKGFEKCSDEAIR